jgi:hypothetical protein
MHWKTIRLELGPTASFPYGSASRAFVLCAPLDERGLIDRQAVAASPRRASVRRFWGSESDEFGQLEHAAGEWCFRISRDHDKAEFCFPPGPYQADATVSVKQSDGAVLPFRVAAVGNLRRFATAAE